MEGYGGYGGDGGIGGFGGVSNPSVGGGFNYGFTGTTPGLTASYDTSPGYSFGDQPGYGLNPGGYDIGGGLGGSLAGQQGYGDYGLDANYGLTSQFSMGQLGQSSYGLQPAGYEGLQAQTSPIAGGYSLGANQATNGFGYQQEPGFWGSKAQKAMSFLANLHPVTGLINTGLQIANSQDPVKAGIQGLLGTLGPVGQMANIGYGAATSPNPAGYLGNTAAMTGAGMVGGMLAGSAGAQAAQGFMGDQIGQQAAADRAIGAFGSGSPMSAGIQSAQAGGGQVGGAPQGGGRDWTDTLMKVGSGLYGMYQGNQQKQLAQQAIGGSAPWTAQGGNQVAGQQLQKVIAGDFTGDAGFKAAQLAAARAGSQQPGGFAASAAARAALQYQNDRIQALGAPAGVGFNPAQGYSTALQGQQQGINTAMAGMGEIGAGMTGTTSGTGMNTMPPWLQQYLIKNNMRS